MYETNVTHIEALFCSRLAIIATGVIYSYHLATEGDLEKEHIVDFVIIGVGYTLFAPSLYWWLGVSMITSFQDVIKTAPLLADVTGNNELESVCECVKIPYIFTRSCFSSCFDHQPGTADGHEIRFRYFATGRENGV